MLASLHVLTVPRLALADEIEALVAFTDKYGWNMQPLRFDETTGGFHV